MALARNLGQQQTCQESTLDLSGDRLLLCTLDGRPLIGKDEGDGCEGIIRRYGGQTSMQPQVRVES